MRRLRQASWDKLSVCLPSGMQALAADSLKIFLTLIFLDGHAALNLSQLSKAMLAVHESCFNTYAILTFHAQLRNAAPHAFSRLGSVFRPPSR